MRFIGTDELIREPVDRGVCGEPELVAEGLILEVFNFASDMREKPMMGEGGKIPEEVEDRAEGDRSSGWTT